MCFGTRSVRTRSTDARMNVVTVAARMGHENVKTTVIYTKPSEAELQAAADRMGVG